MSSSETDTRPLRHVTRLRRRVVIALLLTPLALLVAILLALYPGSRSNRDKADERFRQMSIHVERDWTRIFPVGVDTVNRSVVKATCSNAFSSVKSQELMTCPNLVELDLSDCDPIDVGGLDRLSALRIKRLSLRGTNADDRALATLLKWPALEELALDRTRVTAAGVLDFLTKKPLKRLSIYGVEITASNVEALRTVFPDVEFQ